jgi:hypothetical protein
LENFLRELLSVIQTSVPHVRIALFRRDEGNYQFVRQRVQVDNSRPPDEWQDSDVSGLYNDAATAQFDMLKYVEEFEEN